MCCNFNPVARLYVFWLWPTTAENSLRQNSLNSLVHYKTRPILYNLYKVFFANPQNCPALSCVEIKQKHRKSTISLNSWLIAVCTKWNNFSKFVSLLLRAPLHFCFFSHRLWYFTFSDWPPIPWKILFIQFFFQFKWTVNLIQLRPVISCCTC